MKYLMCYESGGRKEKRQIFVTLRPLEPTFSSECDFTLKVIVLVSVVLYDAKRINVIDRLTHVRSSQS